MGQGLCDKVRDDIGVIQQFLEAKAEYAKVQYKRRKVLSRPYRLPIELPGAMSVTAIFRQPSS